MASFTRRNVVLAAIVLAVVSLLAGAGLATQSRAQPISLASASTSSRSDSAPPACSAGTTVQTATGPVCGTTANGQTSYLDIPYAAPPVGDLRWQPPQPARPWTTTYQATQLGPQCLAPGLTKGTVLAGSSENCLYLEVHEPAGARPGEKLPVMFEIHGGGFLGTALTDNGANLVSSGPVIYVFANYRLGIFGFLADKAFGAHSGDYGLQDQQAALRWTQDN
ncbi:MAG: carboxylesterase family protein, partial [Trebonia sp.]